MLETGEAQISCEFSSTDLEALETQTDKVQVIKAETFNNVIMFINTAVEPGSNADFRRALAYAFPYEETVNEVMNGNAEQSVGTVPAGLWGHSDDIFKYTLDMDKAKEYLEKSGVDTNGLKLTVTYMTGEDTYASALQLYQVNLRQLDCTTYVETVTALTLCMKHRQYAFNDYCRYLRLLRYEGGEVDYVHRLHYFSSWISDNTSMGFVSEPNTPQEAFEATQHLRINYMSTHVGQYPMLVANPAWVDAIRKTEQALTGTDVVYIPKQKLSNTPLYWDAIKDGDIIAICTNKRGLDTSHIGIAVWHIDGVHLLNASMIHKRTIEEPMTMQQYMQKHPSQTGIRVVRLK